MRGIKKGGLLVLFFFIFLVSYVHATDCRFSMTLYDPNDVFVDSCYSNYKNETGLINTCNIGYQKCAITGMYYIDITDNCTSLSQTEDLYMCDATPPNERSTTYPYFNISADNSNNWFKSNWKVYDKGLVLYMPFEVNKGTVVQDESPFNNSGTAVNGPTITNGNIGNGHAMHFDGVDDYVNISSVNPTDAITVATWIKSDSPDDYSGVWQIVSKYNAFILGDQQADNMCFIIYNNTGWNYGSCYNETSPDSWHFFVGTYDSTAQNKSLYVDGKLQDSVKTTGTIYSDTGPIHLGHREGSAVGTYHFNGSIDEVRIYNRSLNSTEIIDLYMSGLIRHELSYSPTTTGDYSPSGGFRDDFGSLDGSWVYSGNSGITWSSASSTLQSKWDSGSGYSYLKKNNYNITGKDVLIDFDMKYSGAERGGIIYRNQTCEISPTGTGWGSTVIGEVGNITIYNTTDYYNRTVTFQNKYSNPIVVAYILSRENTESLEVRVRPENNSLRTNATFYIMKPENSGSINHPENVGYIVMEIGKHRLADGTMVEAGNSFLTSSHNGSASESYHGQTIDFDSDFNKTPVVLHTLNSNYNKNFSTSAVWDITNKNFTAAIELAGTNSVNRSEYMGWIAIEANVTGTLNGVKYETHASNDGTNDGVDDTAHLITYSQSFSSTPVILVSQDSANGADGAWARGSGTNSNTQHGVYAEEDQVDDSERSHTDETFGYWAIEQATNLTGLTKGISSGSWQHMKLYIWGKNSSNVYSSLSFGAEGYFSNEQVKGPFTDDRFGFVSPYSQGYYQVDNLRVIDLNTGIETNISEATDTTAPGVPEDFIVEGFDFGTNHMSWSSIDDDNTIYSFYMRDYDAQDNPSNGITNSDFEDMEYSPWTKFGSSGFNVTSVYHYNGNWSLNVSASVGGGVQQDIRDYADYTNEIILFSCMAKTDSGTLEIGMSATGTNSTITKHNLTTEWQNIQYTAKATGAVTVIINTTTSAGKFYLDDCRFQEILKKSVASGTKDYYVTAIDSQNDSGWQSGLGYSDTGLTCFTEYCYNVKARDNALNVGSAGSNACGYAVPDSDCVNGSGADGYCLKYDGNCYYSVGGSGSCPVTYCDLPGSVKDNACYYDNGAVLNRSDDCTVNGCTGVTSVSHSTCTKGSISNDDYADCWYGTSCNYTNTDPCQADTDGWDMNGGTTLCSAGDTECCPTQGTYADGVNCSKNGVLGTEHDRDDAQSYCEATATDCTVYIWSSVAGKCCGDDTNENFTEAKYEGGACTNGVWYNNHCTNGLKDGEETAVDSGGPWCEDTPSSPTVTLNSSLGLNKTNENLTAYFSLTDNNYDEVFPIIDWRKNSNSIAVLNLPFQVDNSSNAITEDFSTYQNNGTVHGATWTKYGLIGGAYEFDGVDDYIDIPYGSGINPTTQPQTFTMWVKANRPSENQIFFSSGQNGDDRMYLAINGGNWDMGINGSGWGSGTTIVTTDWTLITLIMNGSTALLYINGNYDQKKIYSSYTFNQDIDIGHHAGSTYWFNGSIDEVRIFNRSLSSDQIYQMYLDEVNHHSNLVLNMPFNRNTTYNATGWVDDESQFNNKGRLGDGTSAWAPVWNSTGQIGGNYLFDGNDYINVSDSQSLSPTNEITISVWVKE